MMHFWPNNRIPFFLQNKDFGDKFVVEVSSGVSQEVRTWNFFSLLLLCLV